MSEVLLQADLLLPLFVRGKVRDTYDIGLLLLIVATDRISAFDSVLPVAIPDKGRVLNQLSAFWFLRTKDIIPNHMAFVVNDTGVLAKCLPQKIALPDYLAGRSMVVKKAERINFECVVRGYLAGFAWEEYRKQGTVCGFSLPRGLQESQELPEPLFTPTTKAASGHDLPITLQEMAQTLGDTLAREMRDKSLAVYQSARQYARERGIIIADTKMEFGLDNGKLILIDELLTPDSSRFWDAARYQPGKSQPSYDKQMVRDWLVQSGWNKEPPAPPLPREVVAATSRIYRQAYEKLTGNTLK